MAPGAAAPPHGTLRPRAGALLGRLRRQEDLRLPDSAVEAQG
uniref:Uncharacterized protein n=1 Tax=Arundo donax TaxID=35708 RepID=A0A0A9D9R4_ARUDO